MADVPSLTLCQEWGCIHNSGWDPDRFAYCTHPKPLKKHARGGRLVCVTANYYPVEVAVQEVTRDG